MLQVYQPSPRPLPGRQHDPTPPTATYRVFESTFPAEPGEDDWKLYEEHVPKWQLRRVVRELYARSFDRISILVEREG